MLMVVLTMFGGVLVSAFPTLEYDGDTVFVNDSNAFLSATPHTVQGVQPVEFVVQSKVFTGNVNVLFGYNGEYLKPFKLERWNPHEECYEGIIDYDENNEPINETFCYQFNWTIVTNSQSGFTHVNYNLDGKTDWYYRPNFPIVAGQEYKIRVWIESPLIPFGETQENIYPDYDGKYDFAIYPSSYGNNIIQAYNNGHLYLLDPIIDLATESSILVYNSTEDYVTGDPTNGVWTYQCYNSGTYYTMVWDGGVNRYDCDNVPTDQTGYPHTYNYADGQLKTHSGTNTASWDNVIKFTAPKDATYNVSFLIKSNPSGGNYRKFIVNETGSELDSEVMTINEEWTGTVEIPMLEGQSFYFHQNRYDGSNANDLAIRNEILVYEILVPEPSPPFVIFAKNGFNNTNLTIFNATIDGSLFTTTNGSINSGLLHNDTQLHNITVIAKNHFTITETNLNVSSNYQATMYQSDVSIACFEKITNSSLICDETELVSYNAGTYEITANVSGYYSVTKNITINALDNKTFNFENFYDLIFTIEVRDSQTNASVTDYNLTLTDLINTTYSEELYSGASNQTVFYIVSSRNYTIEFDKPNFVSQSLNKNITGDKLIINASSIAIQLQFFDEITRNAVNNVTYKYYFPSYAVEGNTGASNVVYLPLNETGLLQIEYEKPDDYSLRHYYITVTNTTSEDINLYLLNDSETNFVTVTFTVIDENGVALSDAIVRLQRSYVIGSLRTFITVDSDNSNFNGEGVLTAQEDIIDYIFTIEYDGVNCLTSDPTQVFGSTITLVCTRGEDVVSGWISTYGVTSSISFVEEDGFTASYNDIYSSVSEVCLTINRNSGLGITEVNSSCSSSTSATFSNIGYGNQTGDYTATLSATLSGDKVIINTYSVKVTNGQNLGFLGIFLAFMLVVVAITISIYSVEMGIVFTIIGLVGTKVVGLIPLSFGALSLIVVVGGILLYSIRRGVSS